MLRLMRPILALLCLGTFIASNSALAQIAEPARSIGEVSDRAVPEQVVKLANARVILADYAMLKQDFPELRTLTTEQIDRWLIDHTAFISIPQTAQTETNTPIPVSGEKTTAYRPPDYNRALVFQAGSGMIDSKGNGSLRPAHHGHGHGLATLGEMIREFLYQRLVQKVFDHAGSGRKTLGHYAVLDFGFNVIHNDGSQSRVGSVLRQAHQRATGYMSQLGHADTEAIEKILREYGITSTGTLRPELQVDLLNIQGTKEGAVLDFGGYLVMEKFPRAAVFFLEANNAYAERKFAPNTPDYIVPNPGFRIPFHLWGTSVTGKADSKTDNVFVWSHELAEALANGTATRADAEKHVRNLLDPVDSMLKAHPRPAAPLQVTPLRPVDRPAVDRPAVDRPAVDRPVVDRPVVDRPSVAPPPAAPSGPSCLHMLFKKLIPSRK